MAVELRVPKVGESIVEVVLGEWLRPEGAAANKDEPVVMIETDKVTVELSAPVTGVVTRVLKKKGEKAAVGEVIGYMDEQAVAVSPQAEPPAPSTERRKDGPAASEVQAATAAAAPNPRVTPVARRALEQHGLAATDVEREAPRARVVKEDVLRTVERRRGDGGNGQTPAIEPPRTPGRAEEVVPMTPIRRRIADRLVEAQNTAALLTTFNEVDMRAVIRLRTRYQEAFQEKYGIKLGFMSFFVKASIEALKLVPQVNAEVRGTDIVYRNYHDIGIAVGGGRGLVVPVLRNAERMSFAEIEIAIADFARRARDNKLRLDELTGGTFTISNGGVYGSMLSTPIVNPPQSGVLGLHAIQDRPVVRNGKIVVRPMMYVALTYDHRLVDGRDAVTFLKRIKDVVEDPQRMLLEA